MAKTLAEMTAEIREVVVSKGWRPAEGGPGGNTFGDYLALLHTEIAEATEAYRDHRLADATSTGRCTYPGCVSDDCSEPVIHIHRPPKPEGVGSELADVLIRFLDMCDVFGLTPFDMDLEIGDVSALDIADFARSFGDLMAWLHYRVAAINPDITRSNRSDAIHLPYVLRALVAVARNYGVDLDAEYARKMAYNRTRSYQHGGRTMADEKTGD